MLDQRGSCPSGSPGADIALGVTDHPSVFGRDPVTLERAPQQPRPGLAAIALPGELGDSPRGMVKAVLPPLERDSVGGEQLDRARVHGVKLGLGDDSLCRSGLVRDDDHHMALRHQRRCRLRSAGHQPYLLGM